MAKQITIKKSAVLYFLENVKPKLTKKESDKFFRIVAKKFNIKTDVLKRAYFNYLNYGQVDRRTTRHHKDKSVDWSIVRLHSQNNKKQNEANKNKVQKWTTKETKLILHELYFGSKETRIDFAISHKINYRQLNKAISDLAISGKINRSIIFDFRKYGKYDLNVVLTYAKGITKTHQDLSKPLSKSYKENIRCLRDLSKNDENIVRRLVKVFYFYCK